MQTVILKPLRYFSAMLFLLSTLLLFSGFVSSLPAGVVQWVTWLQFVPSVLKASTALTIGSAGFLTVLVLTLFFGRVYCSFVCPLGTILDAFSRLTPYVAHGRWRVFRYSSLHPLNAISLYLLIASAGFYFFHNIFLLNLFDPFSLSGKVFSVFRGSLLIASGTIFIFGLAGFFSGRKYCNMVCPLGMLLRISSARTVFRISVNSKHCVECGTCEGLCRSACIDHRAHRVDFSRCVACMDCIGACEKSAVRYRYFGFRGRLKKHHKVKQAGKAAPPADPSRRFFLRKSAGGAAALTSLIIPYHFPSPYEMAVNPIPVMPPGSFSLDHFTEHCTACQLCVSSCPTQVLQPSFFEYGASGIFQPKLDFSKAFCSYDCVRCMEVCPTGAIKPLGLKDKQITGLGNAVFTKNQCIVVSERKPCMKCAEKCPVKAIRMIPYLGDLNIPEVLAELCNGCGACEFTCPVKPGKAIYVEGVFRQKKLIRI